MEKNPIIFLTINFLYKKYLYFLVYLEELFS